MFSLSQETLSFQQIYPHCLLICYPGYFTWLFLKNPNFAAAIPIELHRQTKYQQTEKTYYRNVITFHLQELLSLALKHKIWTVFHFIVLSIWANKIEKYNHVSNISIALHKYSPGLKADQEKESMMLHIKLNTLFLLAEIRIAGITCENCHAQIRSCVTKHLFPQTKRNYFHKYYPSVKVFNLLL